MAAYPKTFFETDFTLQDDGRYMATLPAATHGLSTNYHVVKNIRRADDLTWHNVVPVFRMLTNGDFELYVDEPGIYKVYLEGE